MSAVADGMVPVPSLGQWDLATLLGENIVSEGPENRFTFI
jgi:hypothetical protein